MMKKAVLNRKNAYSFRNKTGAKITDILMGVMEICALNQLNPYIFLIAIQRYQENVRRNLKFWLSGVYEKRLKKFRSTLLQLQPPPL